MAVTLAAWALVGWSAAPGFPLDDAWIHQVMARNLAETGVLGFEPGVPGGGSTSVLWTLILTPPHFLGMSPVLYTRLLGLACWMAVVAGLRVIALEDGIPGPLAWVVAAAAACSGNAVWFAWTGMEAVLASALLVWAVAWGRRDRAGVVSVCLGLAVLTRPELAVPAAAIAVASSGWRARCVALAGPALALVVQGLLAAWTTGHPWPATLAGRRWLYGVDRAPLVTDGMDLVSYWTEQLLQYTAGGSVPLLAVILVTAGIGLATLRILRARGWLMLCACAALTLVVYVIVLPRIGHGGRYQPLVAVLALPLAAVGAWGITRRLSGRIAVAAAAFALLAGVSSLAAWETILSSGIAHINATERSMGQYARLHLPDGASVAAFDVGGIAWELPGRVVDLSGLVDGDLTWLRQHRLLERAANRGAGYVVLPFDPSRPMAGIDLFGLSGARIEALHAETGGEADWARAFGATTHAWRGQMLYRFTRPPGS